MGETFRSRDRAADIRLGLVGWILFIVCALFFIAAGIRNRDILTLVGSLFFLVSCIVFIVPLVRERKRTGASPPTVEEAPKPADADRSGTDGT